MTKTKYKALTMYRGHKPGEEFEDDLGAFERLAIDRKQIEKVETKKGKEKADG